MITTAMLADIALPMLLNPCLMFPVMWIVILVEAFFIRRMAGQSLGFAFWVSTKANIYTTILGGIATYFISALTLQGIVIVLEKAGVDRQRLLDFVFLYLGVMPRVPWQYHLLASTFALIPSYYITVYLEYQVLKRNCAAVESKQLLHTAIWMNRNSYLMLLAGALFVYGYRELLMVQYTQ